MLSEVNVLCRCVWYVSICVRLCVGVGVLVYKRISSRERCSGACESQEDGKQHSLCSSSYPFERFEF